MVEAGTTASVWAQAYRSTRSAISPEPKRQGLYSPRQQDHQPMAKLAELKLKQVQQLNTEGSPLLIRKHKEVLNWMMRTFGLDTYGLTWVQFCKGVGLGALAMGLLLR